MHTGSDSCNSNICTNERNKERIMSSNIVKLKVLPGIHPRGGHMGDSVRNTIDCSASFELSGGAKGTSYVINIKILT